MSVTSPSKLSHSRCSKSSSNLARSTRPLFKFKKASLSSSMTLLRQHKNSSSKPMSRPYESSPCLNSEVKRWLILCHRSIWEKECSRSRKGKLSALLAQSARCPTLVIKHRAVLVLRSVQARRGKKPGETNTLARVGATCTCTCTHSSPLSVSSILEQEALEAAPQRMVPLLERLVRAQVVKSEQMSVIWWLTRSNSWRI